MKKNQYKEAHKHASFHRESVLNSERCGCFYCLALFKPSDIKHWCDHGTFQNSTSNIGLTALCPECCVDSVIGSDSGFPINADFLKKMNEYWF